MTLYADWIEWIFFLSTLTSTLYAYYHWHQANLDERKRTRNSYLEIISKAEVERTKLMVYAQLVLFVGGTVSLYMTPPDPDLGITLSDQGAVFRWFVLISNWIICWKLRQGKIRRHEANKEAERQDRLAREKSRRKTDIQGV